MPTAKNASWGFVGEANRKEIDTKVRWMLANQPDHPEAVAVRTVLEKPPPAISPIPPHLLPEGAIVSTSSAPRSKKRAHTERDASGDAAAADGTATTASDAKRPHRHRHHRRNCPRHEQQEQLRQTAAVADTVREVQRGNPLAALQLRRAHDSAAAAASRQDQVGALGYTKASQVIGSDVPFADRATLKPAPSRKERELNALLAADQPTQILPNLYVPGVVGRGMAMFLTGSFDADPHMYDRRPQREHPDFQKVARTFDVTVDETFRATPTVDGSASSIVASPIAKRKLMALPVDKSHCRLKDEVKAHLELACTSAKTMMRSDKRSK